MDRIISGDIQRLQAHGTLGILLPTVPLSLLPVRQGIRRLPSYLFARILCHKGVAAAGMAHDRASIRHSGFVTVSVRFPRNKPDLDTLAVEICPTLRMDPVLCRVHMRRSCR